MLGCPCPTGSREVTVSCRGFCCPSSSAPLASGAPPTPFASGLGVFLGVPDSRNCRPVSSSRGVRLLFRARLRRIRPFPFSDPARLRSPDRSRDSGPPLLGFLLPSKRLYVGCPCSPDQPLGRPGRRRLPHLRRCRPQGSCPSRRFRLRSRHDTNPSRSSPFAVAPRRFAALLHAARVSLEPPRNASTSGAPAHPISR